MSVTIANTELVDSFNTWRLNTNLIATAMSNNVVSVNPGGDASRGGLATGNGHIIGTFSATQLRATTIKGGNTTNEASLSIASNTAITGTLSVSSHATFNGNVIFNQTGQEVVDLGDVAYWRLTGGTAGQVLRITTGGVADLKSLTLRDITNLSSNSSNITLSGANTAFAKSASETPALRFANANDAIAIYMANGAGMTGESDLFVKLADNGGGSAVVFTNNANTTMASVTSTGRLTANTYYNNAGDTMATSGDALALAIALG